MHSNPLRHLFDQIQAERRYFAERDAETLATQLAIATVPAPTGDEAARGHFVRDLLRRRGYDARIDEAGNVVARTDDGESSEPPVVVCAHLDTVFAATVTHGVKLRDGRHFGPSISDNSRGLAGMLAIAGALRESGRKTRAPVLFAATVGEEGVGDLRGARH